MDVETGPPVERFGRHYFDRDQAEYLEMIAPDWHPPGAADVTTKLVACELAQPQADTFLDQVWRFVATTLIVDDPVKGRGLYQRAYVDKLLANPEAHFTRIQGSKLWHLALLEWWLQMHVDSVLGGADAAART